MVTRRRLLLGSAAAIGTVGLGVAGASAWASPRRVVQRQFVGGGMPLPDGTRVPVDYLSRAAWGANESWRDWPAGPEEWRPEHTAYQRLRYTRSPAQTLTVHHTAGNNPGTPAAAVQEVRNIYRYQAVSQGWGDIGYNLLIDPFGCVYEGRYSGAGPWPLFGPAGQQTLMTTGAHILGFNPGNIGVCLLGNLDVPGAVLPWPAWHALTTVLAALARYCGINPRATVNYVNPVPAASPTNPEEPASPEWHATNRVLGVSGHRNWASTGCPGSSFYPTLDQLRIETAAMVDPPVPPSNPRPTGAPAQPEPGQRPTSTTVPEPPAGDRTRSGPPALP